MTESMHQYFLTAYAWRYTGTI